MNPRGVRLSHIFIFLTALLSAVMGGCTSPASENKVLQYASFQTFAAGQFDGDLEISKLKHQGYIGLGTFNRLDGEMIILDDEVYQIRVDGKAAIADDSLRTPFAEATRLNMQIKRTFDKPMSLPQLQQALEATAGRNGGEIIAARMDGIFASIRVRSVPPQDKPYPTLVEAVKQQKVYDCRNIRGTIVAFRFPATAGDLNVQGWHMHFIDADRKVGGHVLALQTKAVQAAVQTTDIIELRLPHRDSAAAPAPVKHNATEAE